MFKRVLVPLDGSERAERALPVVERIARHSGCSITLLQVVSRPAPLIGIYMPQSPAASLIEGDIVAAREYLTHVAEWPLLQGLRVEITVEIGAPAAVIAEAAEAAGADLIVLCSHGRTGAVRWMAGSVAEQVSRQVSIPVLVLREHGPVPRVPDTGGDQALRLRALVPLDGSSFAEAALEPAAALMLALAGIGEAAIHLVVVLPPADADAHTIPEHPALQGTRIYLMRVADRLRAIHPRLTVGWSIEAGHDAARVLPVVAETEGSANLGPVADASAYDLIAMATHGRTGAARWALGSVTQRVLHHTTLPLLVVHPRPAGAQLAAHHAEQPGLSAQAAEQVHATAGEAEALWTPLF